jgi:small subunit ribosomal protein S20
LQFLTLSFILRFATFSESGVKIMANIKSAKKRIGVIAKKTATNRRIKDHLKAVVKNFEKALSEGDLAVAKLKLTLAEKKLKKAAAKNTIHKNAASRKVSRLTKRFNAANTK